MKNIILLLGIVMIGIGWSFEVKGQEDANDIKISLLTCSQGSELYTAFGHSAIRVQDPARGMDVVYNYGIFNFNTPNFYFKFARGRLNYLLGVQRFKSFNSVYKRDNRSVIEQPLNLTPSQETAVVNFLKINRLPENRFYKYDFFYDNCASRIKDVLKEVIQEDIKFEYPESAKGKTFRELIAQNLERMPWVKLGINLILGQTVDREAPAENWMFLPRYLSEFFAQAKVKDEIGVWQKLVEESKDIITAAPYLDDGLPFWKHPIFVFGALTLILVILSLLQLFKGYRLTWLDALLFPILGIMGLIMLFMWFYSDYTVTNENWNMLWGNPLFFLVPVGVFSKKRYFFKGLMLFGIVCCIGVYIIDWVVQWQDIPTEAGILTVGVLMKCLGSFWVK